MYLGLTSRTGHRHVSAMPSLLSRATRHGVRRATALAAFSALALTAGCLGTDKLTGTNNGGQFAATVTGDLQGTLGGNAEVVQVGATSTSPAGVALGLLDVGGTVIAFQWNKVNVVSPGTTAIGTDSTKTLLQIVFPTNSPTGRFTGTSGSITVTDVTPTTASGNFSVVAQNTDNTATINVTGSFQAVVVGAKSP
jgi:hypothetical protein